MKGQAITEFCLSSLIVIAFLVCGAHFLDSLWKRTQCDHEAFKLARIVLEQDSDAIIAWHVLKLPRTVYLANLERNENYVDVKLFCHSGKIQSEVKLPGLESTPW